jgi:hypothetical protein
MSFISGVTYPIFRKSISASVLPPSAPIGDADAKVINDY